MQLAPARKPFADFAAVKAHRVSRLLRAIEGRERGSKKIVGRRTVGWCNRDADVWGRNKRLSSCVDRKRQRFDEHAGQRLQLVGTGTCWSDDEIGARNRVTQARRRFDQRGVACRAACAPVEIVDAVERNDQQSECGLIE